MAADLFAVYGPPTPEQARRLVLLLGLLPPRQDQRKAQEKPPKPKPRAA